MDLTPNGLRAGDRVRYRTGILGTVRSIAHWLNPASVDVRLDNGTIIYDLEIHFEKAQIKEKKNGKV